MSSRCSKNDEDTLKQAASTSKAKHRKSRKPKDMPKRPLSGYNIFFKEERARMLASMSDTKAPGLFATMGKHIAKRWKEITPEEKIPYTEAAAVDLKRYREEMDEYNLNVARRSKAEREQRQADLEAQQNHEKEQLKNFLGTSGIVPSMGGLGPGRDQLNDIFRSLTQNAQPNQIQQDSAAHMQQLLALALQQHQPSQLNASLVQLQQQQQQRQQQLQQQHHHDMLLNLLLQQQQQAPGVQQQTSVMQQQPLQQQQAPPVAISTSMIEELLLQQQQDRQANDYSNLEKREGR